MIVKIESPIETFAKWKAPTCGPDDVLANEILVVVRVKKVIKINGGAYDSKNRKSN